MTDIFKALLLPPGINLLVLLLGFALLPVARKLAGWLLALGIICLYLVSSAPVGRLLINSVEPDVALAEPVQTDGEGAIVVLGSGRYNNAPEYGRSDTAGHVALMRLRYAERLREQTGLPVLTTGGRPHGEHVAEAELMAETLKSAFDGLARWTEGNSRNTLENAVCSQFILQGQGIEHVFLVTHAAHMPRSVYAFRKVGLKVTPAPTGYLGDTFRHANIWTTWLPSIEALQLSRTALHEWLGLLYYKIVYGATASGKGVQVSC